MNAPVTSGSGDRMTWIYGAYWGRVVGLIGRLVRPGDRALIEDFAQDTFIGAWRWLPSARADDEHLFASLATIARRVVADYYRRGRAAREVPVADDDQVWDATAMDGAAADLPGSCTLLDAVDDLPPAVREVVQLRVVNGMSERAVAEVTHHSRRTVQRLAGEGVADLRRRTEVAA